MSAHAPDNPPRRLTAHQVALYGVLTAFSLVLGYLEVLFPLPVAVPGVKLGLGNLVVLYALVVLGPRPAFALMLFKVGSSSVLFGNPAVLPFSLAGGLVSWAVMAGALRTGAFSVTGASVAGGVAHNAGQAVVVALLLGPAVAVVNAPVLLVAGLATGLGVGLVCAAALRALGSQARPTEPRMCNGAGGAILTPHDGVTERGGA